MGKTLGFYANFSLDLDRLSSALRGVAKNPDLNYDALAESMGVNSPVAEGFSGWFRHTGLVTAEAASLPGQRLHYDLTPFGRSVLAHDPNMRDPGTQWMLHYYLASEHIERSDAWFVLFNQFLTPGMRFTAEQYAAYFANRMGGEVRNRNALTKDPQTALGTYTPSRALGRLGLLDKDGPNYKTGWPRWPAALVAGAMLLDWWQRRYDHSDTLRFSQLCTEPGSVGRVCLAASDQVRQFVAALSGMGYLNFAQSQYEPVNRLYHGAPMDLLQRYYQER